MKKSNIAIFIPHLACKNDCVFCNQKRIAGTIAIPTPKEIEEFLENVQPNKNAEIAFFGGSFTGLAEQEMIAYLEIANKFIANGKFGGIRLSTRPDYINENILKTLKEYGVTTIELGAQSMVDGVLKASKRGHNSDDIVKASQLIRAFGFEFVLQMMTGMYLDNDEGVFYTAEKIAELKPNAVRIYPTIVVKDTELEMLYRNGSYQPQSLDDAVAICSKLLLFFEGKGIKVIRLGLHADEGLTDGSIVAGPYHPAFRELCESRIFYDIIEKKLPLNKKEITIFVPKGSISKVVGQKKENISKLKDKYNFQNIYIKEDESLQNRNLRIE